MGHATEGPLVTPHWDYAGNVDRNETVARSLPAGQIIPCDVRADQSAGQGPSQHIDHECQPEALMPAHGQDRAGQRLHRIDGRETIWTDSPVGRNGPSFSTGL